MCSFSAPNLYAKTDALSVIQNDNLSNPFQITMEFAIDDDGLYKCTAHIFYNGVPHGSVDGWGSTPEAACAQAHQSAIFYIKAHGGNYP